MKLIEHFDGFLVNSVNLNQARIDTLEQRVATIENFLSLSDFGPSISRFSPQGSWATKTIIKPPSQKDFDADLLVIVVQLSGWEPKDYIADLLKVFKDSERYKNLSSKNNRCVTLNYKNEFHLDVVLCIEVIENSMPYYFVCNSRANTFEPTDGEGYAFRFAQRNAIVGGNMLIKVARLLKYLRDIKLTFSVKSILLTTLLGMMIEDWDGFQSNVNFPDVPTSLKTIIGRLDNWLQARPFMPLVCNPALQTENFNRHWNQDKYENFRAQIQRYRSWVDDAFNEPDRSKSIAKWREIFGDEFAKGEFASAQASQTRIEVLTRAAAGLTASGRPWSAK